ncbi:hypothetical protein [Mucilaginibacter sp.]|uniref:hypothetical protein n=1 Tax=Mucilaginibacter sp. TaxID=1882438 RepID=UPI002ED274E6
MPITLKGLLSPPGYTMCLPIGFFHPANFVADAFNVIDAESLKAFEKFRPAMMFSFSVATKASSTIKDDRSNLFSD